MLITRKCPRSPSRRSPSLDRGGGEVYFCAMNYARVKRWRQLNPDKVQEQAMRYRAKHPETGRTAALKYKRANIDRVRKEDAERQSTRRSADPVGQKRRMQEFRRRKREKQEIVAGRSRPVTCELCSEGGKIVFDHCHMTGSFRGWLCDRCNKVLGLIKDSPALAIAMAKYLGGAANGKVDD